MQKHARYEGFTLTTEEFLNTIQKFKKKGTIRQYARTVANEIQTVVYILEIEGDLVHQMRLDYSDLTFENAT